MIKPGYFILNGVNSEDIGMLIQDRPQLNAPKRKQKPLEPFGYSGSIIIDEEAYEDSEQELILWVDGRNDREASQKREQIFYMFNSGEYLDFIPYWDPHKIYKIRVEKPLMFTPKHWHNGGQPFSVTVMVAPYKYYVNSPKQIFTEPGSIMNTTLEVAKPIIKVVGSGDVDLIINDKIFIMQNIATDIILDCEMSFAYRELTGGVIDNHNNKTFTRVYPEISPGVNSVNWNGVVSSIEIEPRWRTLI